MNESNLNSGVGLALDAVRDKEGAGSRVVTWWPVIGASVFIGLMSLALSIFQMTRAYPHDQWESIIVADAYRFSAGLDVYTEPETGHATHIYGPLIIYATGLIFKVTGIGFLAAHLIPVFSSICLLAGISAIYFRRLSWVFALAGVAMLLSLNLRLYGFCTQIHTDMPAIAFSLLALIFTFQALEKDHRLCYPLGLICFCIAYLFKQPAAMFTIVPMLSLLLQRRWSVGPWIAAAAAPATVVLLILLIAFTAPEMHFHMIVAVSRWPMRLEVLALSPLRLVEYFILIPAGLSVMMLAGPGISLREPTMRWLIAGCIGALPGSLLSYSKAGGTATSFLPVLIPLIVLSILGIAAAVDNASINHRSSTRLRLFACLMALVMIVDSVETSRESLRAFTRGHGDHRYPKVVEYVRKLKGRVVCPDDPTIPIVALGQPCRSIWAENDLTVWNWMPAHLKDEIVGADYVILVDVPNRKYLTQDTMRSWGFELIDWNGNDMGPYAIWQNTKK